jgi:hypothetical protein
MFFTFPEDARWNAERQAVEFGVEIGEYPVSSGCLGEYSNGYCRRPPPLSAASKPTISNRPGSRPSPSGSCGGGS